MDIESFKIHVGTNPENNRFTFEGIYSNDAGMNEDSIHGDKDKPIPKRPVKYYFAQRHKHPVVFVNTANHAMAEHDNNDRIWKLEYIPWLQNAPVKFGSKNRAEVEKTCKSSVR